MSRTNTTWRMNANRPCSVRSPKNLFDARPMLSCKPVHRSAADRFSERRELARASRDLRTALAGGGSEAGTIGAARLFLERRRVLSRKALGRSVFRISKGARA